MDGVNTTVAHYFESMSRHDWTGLRECLSDQFSRVGPYEDHHWSNPEAYLDFLRELLPGIEGQKVQVTQTIEEGSVVHVNATETIQRDGAPHSVRVAATFQMNDDDRIDHIEVFVRRLSPSEPVD